jgi:hypothetical protein
MSGVLDDDRDPYSVKHIRRSPDWIPPWFDGRYALLLPGRDEFLLIVPEYVPLADPIGDLVLPVASKIGSLPTTGDGRPIFASYSGGKPSVLSKIKNLELGAVKWGTLTVKDLDEYSALSSKPLPIKADEPIELYGYSVLTELDPGAELQVLTLWEFSSTADEKWVAFVHLIDEEGRWKAGYDRLDVAPSSAEAGHIAVQLHRLAIPEDLSSGVYTLRAGIYERQSMRRLAWQVEPGTTTDHLILCLLEVP